jgi:two-component system response regulator (stage 0 sporulation protein A)
MDSRRLLIADGTEEFVSALAAALRGVYELRTCRTGTEALELVQTYRPDVMVLDLMLPGLDGISLLQSQPVQELRPIVLAVSRFASDYMVESIEQLGVGYLMLKPCDIKATVARIGDLTQRITPPAVTPADNKTRITNTLLTLGVPTKLRGYAYLREAVEVMAQRPGLSITKELYPTVGQRCDASPENVERSIRSAINAAWKNRDEQVWRMYFGTSTSQSLRCPTNAAFISRLADGLPQSRISE